MPGIKGRVIAFTDELDSWRSQAIISGDSQAPVLVGNRRTGKYLALAGAMGILVAAVLFIRTPSLDRLRPASYRIENRDLVVLASQGQEIWRHSFPETLYARVYMDPEEDPKANFLDLDEDGTTEILFIYYPVSRTERGGSLVCFSATGRQKWSFLPGRMVHDGERSYSHSYLVNCLAKVSGSDRIVASSHHVSYYPSQVALLDSSGTLLGEYWHSGYLYFIRLLDIDGDGIEEVLLGGIDNSQRAATLVVLELPSLELVSAQQAGGKYQLQPFAAAKERAIVLFPRTCMNLKLGEYNRVSGLTVTGDEIIVDVSEIPGEPDGRLVKYHLTHDLRLKHLDFSDALREQHRQLEAEGVLNHSLSDEEISRLKRSLIVLKKS